MTRTLFAVSLLVLVVPAPAVLAGPPAAPGADFGKTMVEIPVPSKWVVVEGWKGKTPVTDGQLRFLQGKKVEITWSAREVRGPFFATTYTREWDIDPKSNLPVIGRDQSKAVQAIVGTGTFRFVGRRLEFKMGDSAFSTLAEPIGDLILVLKPARK